MPTPYRDPALYRSAIPYQGATAVPVYGGATVQGSGVLQETAMLLVVASSLSLVGNGVLDETSLLLASSGAISLVGDGVLSASGASLLSASAELVGQGVLQRIVSVDGRATLQGAGVLTPAGVARRFSELLQLVGEGALVIDTRLGARSATLALSEAIIR